MSEQVDDRPPESAPAERTLVEERKLSPMRRTIADRLQESYREAVHVTVHREIDAEALVATAKRIDERTEADVSILDVLLLVVSATLEEHPGLNATFEDGTHRVYEEHNLAVAIDVPAGLVTPVIRDVTGKSVPEIAVERRRLSDLVQAGDHSMSDLRGGTFTVSNLGPLGVDAFTPIINPPEVAILGVNRLRDRAVPGASGVEFRRQLPLSLSIDHRVVDGADGARFLETLASHMQETEVLL